jgi:hypothetical protein
MQRIVHKQVGEHLLEALRSSTNTFDTIMDVYTLANANFTRQADDIDPGTISAGLQGQALAVLVITQWLDALATVLGASYKLYAQEGRQYVVEEMERMGIVIPTPNTL